MATLRQQIATNVLTVTRFRDLLRRVRSYRPGDDLYFHQESLRILFPASQRPGPRLGRAVSGASAAGRNHPGRDAAGHHGHHRRTVARCGRGHLGHHRGDQGGVWRAGRAHRRGRNQNQQNRLRLVAKKRRRKTCARWCWPWWTTFASCSSNWPIACTTCAP